MLFANLSGTLGAASPRTVSWRARQHDRFNANRYHQREGVMNQDAWVHWDYSPEEWALFDRIDWRMGRRAAFWLLIGLPISLLESPFFFWGGLQVIVPVFALSLLAVFEVACLAYFQSRGPSASSGSPQAGPAPSSDPFKGWHLVGRYPLPSEPGLLQRRWKMSR